MTRAQEADVSFNPNLLTCVVPSSRVDATLEDLHEVE